MSNRFVTFAAGFMLLAAPSANGAGIGLLDIFKNVVYSQTSGAAPTTPASFFANVELTSQSAGDFTNVSVAYPGPASPLSLPQVSPTFFGVGPSFATQAAMNAAVPFGSYVYTATSGGLSQTATLSYTTDAFAAAVPALSAASFSALQGLSPSSPLTINFNSFTPSASASQGFTFFSIFNSSGTVFTAGFLAPGSTSLVIPANVLSANTAYTFELDFSDRINGGSANGVATLVGSDVRTDGTFTTGSIAPEPATLLLLGGGLVLVAAGRRLRRRSFGFRV